MHQSRHKTVTQGLLDLKRLSGTVAASVRGSGVVVAPTSTWLKLPSYRFWDLLWMPHPGSRGDLIPNSVKFQT